MTDKEIRNSGISAIVSTVHALMCPSHGLVPIVLNTVAGSSSALTEYEVFSPFEWLHNVQVEGVNYFYQAFDPYEAPAQQASGLYGVVAHDHSEDCQVEHTTHTHENLHPHTESTVAGLNYMMMLTSLFFLGKSIYKKFQKK